MTGTSIASSSIEGLWDGATNGDWDKCNNTRHWWNPVPGRWDGIIHKDDGAVDCDAYIATDITGTITYVVETEHRSSARPDIFWDAAYSGTEPKARLYVYHSHGTTPELDIYSYNTATDTYAAVTVDKGGVDDLKYTSTSSNPGSMWVGVNGYIWAAILNDFGLQVQRSTDDGANWSTVYNLDAVLNTGVCEVIGWNDGSNDRIGVWGSENANGSIAFHHILETADPTSAGNWTDDTPIMPSGGGSDNHSNAIVHNNIIYIVMKTEGGTGVDPLILLWKRTAAGEWTDHEVWDHNRSIEPSRPQLCIDETNDIMYCAYIEATGTNTGNGYIYQAELSELNIWAGETQIFLNSTDEYRDIYLPQSPVTSTSNILALSDNAVDYTIWYNDVSITGSIGDTVTHTAQFDNALNSTNFALGHTFTKNKGGAGEEVATSVAAVTTADSDFIAWTMSYASGAPINGTDTVIDDYLASVGDMKDASTDIAVEDYSKLAEGAFVCA